MDFSDSRWYQEWVTLMGGGVGAGRQARAGVLVRKQGMRSGRPPAFCAALDPVCRAAVCHT